MKYRVYMTKVVRYEKTVLVEVPPGQNSDDAEAMVNMRTVKWNKRPSSVSRQKTACYVSGR